MPRFHYHPLPDHSTLLARCAPREFCGFPHGVYHALLEAQPPLEMLMIRTPSMDDKQYRDG